MAKDKITKPWLDSNGCVYGDSHLREISRSWTAETWESFLTDTVDKVQREDLISPRSYDQALEETHTTIWDSADSTHSDEDFVTLRRLIRDHLTPRQQQTIRLTFWDGFSERKIAEIMNVSRRMVATNKLRSLNKLKHLIEKRIPNFSPYVGTSKFKHTERHRFSDLQEIYENQVRGVDFGNFRGNV